MPFSQLGQVRSDNIALPGGAARIHEFGFALLDGADREIGGFTFPKIGRPAVCWGPGGSSNLGNGVLSCWGDSPAGWAATTRPLLQGLIGLAATGVATSPVVSLQLGDATDLGHSIVDIVTHPGETRLGIDATATGLQDGTLYDIVLVSPDGRRHVLAPHAVYYKADWTNFGFVHVTDMHVARRIDSFRGLLRQAGRTEAADKIYNWNDRFRGFVKYANYLHSIGKLDVIFATGDLYDYIYERGEPHTGGGNAAFLRDLLLGKAPGPEFPHVEELRVPIFMVPGNHDYRLNPYELIFDIHIGGDTIGKDLARLRNFSGYCIGDDDAKALNQLIHGGHGTDVRNLDSDAAAAQVAITDAPPCREVLCGGSGPYVVHLGPHRFLMFDSRHDVGVVDSAWDAVKKYFNYLNEDQRTFVGGSPNCDGLHDGEVDWAKVELNKDSDGLIVACMHAPLLNTTGAEYPYFMRETQRGSHADQPGAYLAARDPTIFVASVLPPINVTDWEKVKVRARERHASWFADPDAMVWTPTGNPQPSNPSRASSGPAAGPAVGGVGDRRGDGGVIVRDHRGQPGSRERDRPESGRPHARGFGLTNEGGPVVRDHRGGASGGDGPVVRDHRDGASGGDGPVVRDHRGTTFFKRGDISDLLDFGVASAREHKPDGAYSMLRLLAGQGTKRAADMVLTGHTHKHNEFRVGVTPNGELQYFLDFYTSNPSSYYPTTFLTTWPEYKNQDNFSLVVRKVNEAYSKTYVDIAAGSPPDTAPHPVSGWLHKFAVKVPPYPNPLNSSQNISQWWDFHRPLVIQTSALGPLDDSQATFTGFRVFTVTNNLINRADFIATHRLEETNYTLPFDEAIKPDNPVSR